MMMKMLFQKEKGILLLPLAIIILLLMSVSVLSLASGNTYLQSYGTIVYSEASEYLMVNSTGTYELNSQKQAVFSSTNSLAVWNHAINAVSSLKGSLFVYNGTYQINGTIRMLSNVNITLQDGVFINETSKNVNIFSFASISNAAILANTNATIHGLGTQNDVGNGFYLFATNNITIASNSTTGLKIYNIGNLWFGGANINYTVLKNIYAYNWALGGTYYQGGCSIDGGCNNQILYVTSDANNTYCRSPLVIGGQSGPAINNTIIGGLYADSPNDNGIYLGGWQYPVLNTLIINVTTANNTASGHAGIKMRPATNTTVINWTSNGDYNGMELGSTYESIADPVAASYNNVSGTINSPLGCGLVLSMDYADVDYHLAYNWFNITVNNATQQAVWVDNPFANATGINNNTIYLAATGCRKQAVDFANMAGNVSYNTIYGTFVQNGKSGFPDISFENTTAQKYNVVNVYSTAGNPNGLYAGLLGTNLVNYPYAP
jgi:hypothetical protein